MEDKLKKQVEEAVNAIFASKEEDTNRAKAEVALQASADTIQDLTSKVEAANEATTVVETKVTELEAQVETATAEKAEMVEQHEVALKEAVDAKEVADTELEKVALELATMKQEITADTRMAELQTAGVVREAADVQRAKVMTMSDEEFAAYSEELVSIKTQVIESLKVKEDASADDASADDAAADDAAADTPPAHIDTELKAQAALNLESKPSPDMAAKYLDLGKAMAEAIK